MRTKITHHSTSRPDDDREEENNQDKVNLDSNTGHFCDDVDDGEDDVDDDNQDKVDLHFHY